VRFPCSEADPTEVIFASFAHHVITPTILLNRRLTLGTFLPAKPVTLLHLNIN